MTTVLIVLLVLLLVILIGKIIISVLGLEINIEADFSGSEDFDENKNVWGIINIRVDNNSKAFDKYVQYIESRIDKYGMFDEERMAKAYFGDASELERPGFKAVIYDETNNIFILPAELVMEIAKGKEDAPAFVHHLHMIHPDAQFIIGDTPPEMTETAQKSLVCENRQAS